MTDEKKHSKKAAKHSETRVDLAFGISLSEWVVASVVGLGSGIATAAKTIRDHFHYDVKDSTDFEAFFAKRKTELDKVKFTGNTREDFYSWAKKTAGVKRDHAIEFDTLAEKFRGVRKSFVLGTYDRFFPLSPRSKNDLYFKTTIGTIIGTAMTLSFFNGVATRDKIEKIEDAVTSKETAR